MKQQFYVLAYATWEDYVPHFFSGPEMTQDGFQSMCDSLLEVAAMGALLSENNRNDYIGWNEIVEAMIPFLEANGFTHINPTKVDYSGPGIIDAIDDWHKTDKLGDVAQQIVNHNLYIQNLPIDI